MRQTILHNILCSLFALFFFCGNAQTTKECDSITELGLKAAEKNEYAKAIEFFIKAGDMAEKNGWQDQLFWAKNNIGGTYFSIKDYSEALKYFLESYEISRNSPKWRHEMTAVGNIALLYAKEKNYDKANAFLKRALAIAEKHGDKGIITIWAIDLANNANQRMDLDEALKYIQKVYENTDDQKIINMAKMVAAENDLLRGNSSLARKKAQEVYLNTADLDSHDIGITLQIIIIKSYIAEKDLDNAIRTINVALSQVHDAETRRNIYLLLVEVYEAQGLYKNVAQYKDSIIKTDKEINDLKNGRIYESNKVKFEIENYKRDVGHREEKLNNERNLLYAIIGMGIAIFVIAFLLFRTRYIKNSKQKALAEQNEKIIALELEKQKSNSLLLEQQIKEREASALLEQEQLKNEIESRNRELSSKEFYISGRNQLIKDILETLTQNSKLKKDPAIENHIKTLKSHLLDSNDQQSFISHFEQVNQGLLKKLQALHPSLTANDIRFIAYVYMNLSNKEIATILNITPFACSKRKERIMTKLELSKNVSLYTYLSSI
jgi:DNA-binding CsgD family transcriptional regulator